MSDIMEYKCPACDGTMIFDSKTQKMKCPFCDTEMDVEAFERMQKEKAAGEEASGGSDTAGGAGAAKTAGTAGTASENVDWTSAGNSEWQAGETNGMRIYACQSCGGEIVADESTGATMCPFCGNRVVMKGQFEGDLKPDYVIPFKLDKKAAKDAYHRHLKGKYFMPKVFKEENHIGEIKGVYVPFWLFDADVSASANFEAHKNRSWRNGDMEYTEHEIYSVDRAGSQSFEHVPADGSKKMDDTLMESIEPFHFADAVPFTTAYLSGYVANRYDVEMEKCIGRAQERMKDSAIRNLESTVQGYSYVERKQKSVQIANARYLYVLYPVWILNTKWRNKRYIFAMNGQTGKMVGDLPFDKNEFKKYIITRGVAIGAVIYAIMWAFTLL